MKHSVINKEEEEDKDKEEGEENLGTSKFEAALKDLEALGRGQGTRYFLIMILFVSRQILTLVFIARWEAVPQPRVWAEEGEDRAEKQKRSSGDFFDRKKTTCMLYLQVPSKLRLPN